MHLRPSLATLAISASLAGCAEDPLADYWDIRETCGLDPSTYPYGSDDGNHPEFLITEVCAESLGDALGLQWEEFDAEPHAISIATTADEGVVAGLFSLIAPDVGTYGSIEEADDLPAWLTDEVVALGDDLSGDDPAGAFWWHVVTSKLISTQLDASGQYLFRYGDAGTLIVGEHMMYDGHLAEQPTELASYLVHEAGHSAAPGHVQCPFLINDEYLWQCDEDPDGTVGSEAWWLNDWLSRYSDEVSTTYCKVVQGELQSACERILEPGTFSPCLDASGFCPPY